MNAFQERLNELLQENNTNRLQLAKAIGISSTTVNGYFNKGYYPEISIAVKIAIHFGCSLDYLFGLTDDIQVLRDYENANLLQNFINNFDKIIKENRLSIAKTMKKLKMSEADYYRWKAGRFPKTANLLTIAERFGSTIDRLLG